MNQNMDLSRSNTDPAQAARLGGILKPTPVICFLLSINIQAKDMCVLTDLKYTILETSFHKQGGSIEVSHAAQQNKMRVRLCDFRLWGQNHPRTCFSIRIVRMLHYHHLPNSWLTEERRGAHSCPEPQALLLILKNCETVEIHRHLQLRQVSTHPPSRFNA